MAETPAHLGDHVVPALAVRQWVISFPKRLRDFLQRDPAVRSAALRVVLRVIEQALKEQSSGAGPTSHIGAVACIHHFGASRNQHTPFHSCLIDGVCAGAEDDSPLTFFEATAMDAARVAAVQSTMRRRILSLFVRRALRAADAAKDRSAWQHDGGFSLDAGVRSEGHDRHGRERLLRYCARPPFARERIERSEQERILYHLPKPTPEGQIRLTLSPLERIARLAALIPAPRRHRHRDSGVLAPNTRRRPAVTAMACEARATGEAGTPANAEEDNETASRSPARYLWAMRLARLYAVFPLLCPACGAPLRIIAFITEYAGDAPDPGPHRRAFHTATARPGAGQSCSAWVPARTIPGSGVRYFIAAHPPGGDSEETTQEDSTWGFPPVDPQPDYDHHQSVSW
jgi:hypothetical protein